MGRGRFSRGVTTATILALGVVVGLADGGCGGGTPTAGRAGTASPSGRAASPTSTGAAASPSPAAAGSRCAADAAAGSQVRFANSAGTPLAGLVFGNGRTGVILAHQRRGDVCQWLWYARDLVSAGYRVLAFDFSGDGASASGPATPAEDVVAAAGFLRGQGVAKIALVGASKGGTAVVGAAAVITPAVAAVVSLSGPARFGGVDAAAAAAKLTAPVLYAAARDDQPYAAEAQQLYDATPAGPRRTVLIVGGLAHGVGLLNTDRQVRAAVDAFLRTNAPPA